MMVRENAPWVVREFREAMKSWGLAVLILVWGAYRIGPWLDAKAESEKMTAKAFEKLVQDNDSSHGAQLEALREIMAQLKNYQAAPQSGAKG